MSTVDAAMYWSSATQHSDIFTILCFDAPDLCFDAPDASVFMDAVLSELRERARRIDDLCLRVLNVPGDLDWPHWVRSDIGPDAFAVHPVRTWQESLDRIGELAGDQLDPTECPWRIHVFGPIAGAPRGCADEDGAAIVLALQISHTLADGRGTAAICLGMFGEPTQDAPTRRTGPDSGRMQLMRWRLAAAGMVRLPVSVAVTAWLGLRWLAECRKAVRRGRVTGVPMAGGPWAMGVPLTELNRSPGPGRTLRVIVLDRGALPTGPSVTAVTLTAISYALDELLGPAHRRTAAVPVGLPPCPGSHNNYGNLPIDLYPETDAVGERMARIAGELTAIQQRVAIRTPVMVAGARAESALPAFLARWGLRRLETRATSDTVTGVTVVTSVNAESADLPMTGGRLDGALAGGRIRFAAGFPYLTEYMGLGHGVIGIGPVVAISVITSPDIVDADAYVDMLRRALDRVAAEGSPQP
ncbi:wax ester/triacylglycerol synthase domain-containing protein [Gordonia sp. (in: high G+C Gram-positive bacteria)]|jgi:hypothetical protein|uniref:wax ester/triacylglycerol synthase domain-containing protein n=1 Tax=Gordonia sp. (in: high G+C Gram-positive bacteria) TaxID=84139 RepID=UPI0025C2D790|nr:wax ester/triacylglycerol synthase domain-containing protein [Gordonia sp. (in: high G+C Gram-positive bacteria)]HMS73622.1 wax ester/triacylglycerol synthase family O-acyltransferase [Gordonia sp. (in: high G+C Gram-positive bacteria)]